jgi:hypothetical protein
MSMILRLERLRHSMGGSMYMFVFWFGAASPWGGAKQPIPRRESGCLSDVHEPHLAELLQLQDPTDSTARESGCTIAWCNVFRLYMYSDCTVVWCKGVFAKSGPPPDCDHTKHYAIIE